MRRRMLSGSCRAALAPWLGLAVTCLSMGAGPAQAQLELLPLVEEPPTVVPWGEAEPSMLIDQSASLPPGAIVAAAPSGEPGGWWPSVSPSPSWFSYRHAAGDACQRFGALDCVPTMIGDGGSGTNVAFDGLLEASLALPALGANRLNIADANSPLPTDRVYYSYRHLHNAGAVAVHQFSESVDFDQHTLAWENATQNRAASLEIRAPIEYRMSSEFLSLIAPTSDFVDPIAAAGGEQRAEFGNLSLIAKLLIWERPTHVVSAGLGVTLPTAEDVDYLLAIDGELAYRDLPGLTADQASIYNAYFSNQTVYLSPYLAWSAAPRRRWFHQGFLQVEAAANPSRVTFSGAGLADFYQDGALVGLVDFATVVPRRVELFPETLLRLNLGGGYVLAEGDAGGFQLASIFELHYTAVLSNAKFAEMPLDFVGAGLVPFDSIRIGNDDSRGDVVNAAAGLSARWGRWLLTNGVIVPLREDPDRAYDAAYNLQLQRRF
jgi:hypothetical protein